MSNLKTILVELENCVQSDQHSPDIPSVWSRDFHIKLAQATDHWKIVQNRKSHTRDMDFQDEEDGNIQLPYDGEQTIRMKGEFEVNKYEEEETGSTCTYGDAYRKHTQGTESESKCMYGDAYRKHMSADEEEEETKAKASFSTRGMKGEHSDDCKTCYGTGMDFPRLKGDCEACGGSGKVKEEQAEEEVVQQGGNRTDATNQQPRPQEGNPDEQDPENIAVDDQYGLDDPNDTDDEEEPDVEPQEWDDPDFQGAIRVVAGAHLVFKRQQEDGTFEELWQYNLGDDFKKELKIRRAILAGTDIPINKLRSPDNSQTYDIWTVGNGQLMKVKGLPN